MIKYSAVNRVDNWIFRILFSKKEALLNNVNEVLDNFPVQIDARLLFENGKNKPKIPKKLKINFYYYYLNKFIYIF